MRENKSCILSSGFDFLRCLTVNPVGLAALSCPSFDSQYQNSSFVGGSLVKFMCLVFPITLLKCSSQFSRMDSSHRGLY
jgi:hypothetical protein